MKCPECGVEIDYLICDQSTTWKLSPDGTYALLGMSMKWACPVCEKTLFSGLLEGEMEAREWLAQ